MLLIFGIRAVTDLFATPSYACERCGRYARHEVLRERRRLSLFFIPVLTLGRARYVDECTACGRLRDVSSEQAHATPAAVGPQDSLTWTPQDRSV
jgi:uncharacterized Zn finger protein